jgi:hypothetical protein
VDLVRDVPSVFSHFCGEDMDLILAGLGISLWRRGGVPLSLFPPGIDALHETAVRAGKSISQIRLAYLSPSTTKPALFAKPVCEPKDSSRGRLRGSRGYPGTPVILSQVARHACLALRVDEVHIRQNTLEA